MPELIFSSFDEITLQIVVQYVLSLFSIQTNPPKQNVLTLFLLSLLIPNIGTLIISHECLLSEILHVGGREKCGGNWG